MNWPAQQQPQHPPVYQQPQQQRLYGYEQGKPERKKMSLWLIVCLGLMVFVVLVGGIIFAIDMGSQVTPSTTQGPAMSVEEIKSGAVTIPYDDLMRNNQAYVGKVAYYRGGVVQVSEVYGDRYALRVATKEAEYLGYFENVIWVNYRGQRLLEGDIVDVWAEVKGLKTYTAVLGNEVTIPELDSLHLELVAKAGDVSK
jgi:hypothetical protein